jgi:hypothetical protein
MKSDHIKRMIALTGDNIKRLSLYLTLGSGEGVYEVSHILLLFSETLF